MPRNLPRLFRVSWTNSRKNTRDARRYDANEAFGTQYPNGFVTLDNGASFEMLADLRRFLAEYGEYTLTYLDEQAESAGSGPGGSGQGGTLSVSQLAHAPRLVPFNLRELRTRRYAS